MRHQALFAIKNGDAGFIAGRFYSKYAHNSYSIMICTSFIGAQGPNCNGLGYFLVFDLRRRNRNRPAPEHYPVWLQSVTPALVFGDVGLLILLQTASKGLCYLHVCFCEIVS